MAFLRVLMGLGMVLMGSPALCTHCGKMALWWAIQLHSGIEGKGFAQHPGFWHLAKGF